MVRKKKGLALIKILIVVVIIGIIAGIAIPRFLRAQKSRLEAKVAQAFAEMETLAEVLEMHYRDYGRYPIIGQGGDLRLALDLKKYLAVIPTDPFGNASVIHYRYYSTKDACLIISNGPDGRSDVTAPNFDESTGAVRVSGELGGPDGVIGTYYGSNKWSRATSRKDKGDIGRGGP